jgi:hypothetical protein
MVPTLEDALCAGFALRGGMSFVSLSRKSRNTVTVVYQYAPAAFGTIEASSYRSLSESIDDDLYDDVLAQLDQRRLDDPR